MKIFFNVFFSLKTTVVLLLLLAASLAIATFIEDKFDTLAARVLVYNAKWFEFLLLLLILNFIGNINKYKLFTWRKAPMLVFHFAFIVLILGSAATRYFGFEGTMHIREGKSSNIVYQLSVISNQSSVTENGRLKTENREIELPFSLYLNHFILKRYPGSMSPSSFESNVTLIDDRNNLREEHRIFMNNVLNYNGYRFFQSSYDRDEKGTILSVNHDFYGTWISYTGYFLLALGFLLSLLNKNSHFNSLHRKINEIRKFRKEANLVSCALCLMSLCAFSQNSNPQNPVTAKEADKFGHLIVQSFDGRFEPVHTLAYDVMHKISGKDNFNVVGKGRMDAMQVFMDMFLDMDFWKDRKIIYIRETSVRNILKITGSYASFNDFFTKDAKYKLADLAENAFRKNSSQQNTLDKEILKVDERVNICMDVFKGNMLKIFPQQYSPANSFRLYFIELLKSLKSNDYSVPDKILGYIESIQRQGASLSCCLPNQ